MGTTEIDTGCPEKIIFIQKLYEAEKQLLVYFFFKQVVNFSLLAAAAELSCYVLTLL